MCLFEAYIHIEHLFFYRISLSNTVTTSVLNYIAKFWGPNMFKSAITLEPICLRTV